MIPSLLVQICERCQPTRKSRHPRSKGWSFSNSLSSNKWIHRWMYKVFNTFKGSEGLTWHSELPTLQVTRKGCKIKWRQSNYAGWMMSFPAWLRSQVCKLSQKSCMRSCLNHVTVNTKYCLCATNIKLFIIIILIVAVVHGRPHSPCFSVACCSTGVCVTHHRGEEQLLWQRCGFYKDHCTNNEVNQKHKAESVGGEEEWGDTDICVPRIDIRATLNDTTQRQETGPMSEHRGGGDASLHGGSAENIFESNRCSRCIHGLTFRMLFAS